MRVDLARHLTQLQIISLDTCTRCCECLRWCPVLDITGDESLTTPEKIRVFGDLGREQHGAPLFPSKLGGRGAGGTVQVKPEVMEKLTEALYACTTCGVCGEVCPVGINTQRLWPAMRATMVDLGHGPVGGQRQAEAIVREKHNPYDQPHADRFAWLPPDVAVAERAEIGYYCGCSGAYTAQPMLIGALRMFQAAGIEFTLFDDEWCCSFPLFILGELDLATELVRHNVEGFEARGVKRLVVSCPCCMFMLREHWPTLYGGALPFDVVHITQVMTEKIKSGQVKFSQPLPETITYHDPCYLARGVRILDEPRQIIGAFPDVRFVEMERCRELSKCCGAGGGIRRAYPQLSIDMGRALIRDAERVGAKIMVIDCPACYERLHLAKQGFDTDLQIMDLMQLAAELL